MATVNAKLLIYLITITVAQLPFGGKADINFGSSNPANNNDLSGYLSVRTYFFFLKYCFIDKDKNKNNNSKQWQWQWQQQQRQQQVRFK